MVVSIASRLEDIAHGPFSAHIRDQLETREVALGTEILAINKDSELRPDTKSLTLNLTL